MYDINHKTVFVLDHTQYFSISSKNYIELDFLKSKASTSNDVVSLPPFSKSLWTCSVEASVEYCRIVWDVFPRGKLIRFIVSNTKAHLTNTWGTNTQNLTHVLHGMSALGPPEIPARSNTQSTDSSVIHGMKSAIDALIEPTDKQKDFQKANKSDCEKVVNKGRIICITSARDNDSMASLEDIFHSVLLQENEIAAKKKDEGYLTIDHCHLVIINVFPMNMETLVSNKSVREISSCLTSEIHSVAAPDISNKLTHLILSHYDLASTTVTGIPMKEEQNANSSANYDVEILHPRNAHTVICGSELLLPTSIKENAEYETVTLKWCTPRGCGASEMQPCLAQHRVTPVDVTSRPSSCLINFLLNGRSVLLEMPRKPGGKLTSHLLSARGGEIFIHTLHITRTCLEDPPSISEGGGGRVTDYRIADFGQFIRAHKLFPLKPLPDRSCDENLLKCRTKLYRHSRYFPLTLSTTFVYNLRPYLEILITTVEKDELAENDVIQCRQIIFNILGFASRQEQLPLPNMGHRLKGSKRDEQYKLLWSELELLVRSSGNSVGHKTVLSCLQDCRTKNGDSEVGNHRSVIRAITDSPLSPPHSIDSSIVNKPKRATINGHRSLLDIFTTTERKQNQNRLDFAGRLCTPPGQVAHLYPNLGVKEIKTEDDTKQQLKI